MLINNILIKANCPKSNSNKVHKFQQITKQGKEMYNVRQTGTNADYKYSMFCK